MLTTFPQFRTLRLEDRHEIESITRQFPPYSDYNFVSLWSWHGQDDIVIARHGQCLVVQFKDYLTGVRFLSVIGRSNVDTVIVSTLDYAAAHAMEPKLSLVPEATVQALHNPHQFTIQEDRDNFDYILRIDQFIELQTGSQSRKRNLINTFKSRYGDHATIRPLDVTTPTAQKQIMQLFNKWEQEKNLKSSQTARERMAILQLLSRSAAFGLESLGLYYHQELIGFSINELVHNDHVMGHFTKARPSYKGATQYLTQATALQLRFCRCRFINAQQDLGIAGLRSAKLAYNPDHFLKKYTLQLAKAD
ncbi:MAG TPA: phosphatidylglycerol lysyltransferase domain-containing protein [Candidatus Polarisedimenticolaceae bacterium]|nr:phosphatidylglycerol lysyltransferase domain-containing protein [Candidatus Polarisedimenticolaceae bacterium]